MKRHIILTALALITSGSINAASMNQELCTTTSFEVFGEPKQTVRDCANPDESFRVMVSIDGSTFPEQGIGLVVPQTYYEQNGHKSVMLTIQVTKDVNVYTIRFQSTGNGQVVYWKGNMKPGEHRSLKVDGHNVGVHFTRQ